MMLKLHLFHTTKSVTFVIRHLKKMTRLLYLDANIAIISNVYTFGFKPNKPVHIVIVSLIHPDLRT